MFAPGIERPSEEGSINFKFKHRMLADNIPTIGWQLPIDLTVLSFKRIRFALDSYFKVNTTPSFDMQEASKQH